MNKVTNATLITIALVLVIAIITVSRIQKIYINDEPINNTQTESPQAQDRELSPVLVHTKCSNLSYFSAFDDFDKGFLAA